MDLNALTGGVAVLTGAGSGLGLALAHKSASLHMHVVISDVRVEVAEKAAQEVSEKYPRIRCVSFGCDVTKTDEVRKLLEYTKDVFAGKYIQFVGANAGILIPKATVLAGSYEDWFRTYDVNVLGLFNTLRTFVPVLVKQPVQSAIITASLAGVSPGFWGPYGTSKLAALGMAEALYQELQLIQENSVSVLALCPGVVNTDLQESSAKFTAHHSKVDSNRGGAAQDDGFSHLAENVNNLFQRFWGQGTMTSEFCAEKVFEYLESGKFYCFLDGGSETSPIIKQILKQRYNNMMSRRIDLGKL
mmetsp:Transcript_3773/g.5106  ORF Transcript_3773/g.5106 Transcript_3773/m.5106 type:complete len:302 (+) Transcript_3773:201-1106(+)